jgi:hypothetical protein
MKLAHETPHARKINDKEIFRWNYTDTSQFVLVDPDGMGWTLIFVPERGPVPAHLAIKSPKTPRPESSPVYVLVKDDVGPDHEIFTVHDVPSAGMAGTVDRYAGPDDFIATLHASGNVRVIVSENGIASTLVKTDKKPDSLVDSVSKVRRGLLSVRVSGVSAIGLKSDDCLAMTSGRAGFMVYAPCDLSETIRVFDFHIERVR